ncbi:uncharacterized protein LOC127846081 [Dreissena polymorpha]|uniref:uncharacterized protein LOC127846081 n=1 Tax=Dreissena polymorpha TaxID=45954 RepID=UPI002264E27E|nr:uncharacterized protein LOC127846081 [Dreissena polymorpha]
MNDVERQGSDGNGVQEVVEEGNPLLPRTELAGDRNEPDRRDSGRSSWSNLTESPRSNRSHSGSSIVQGSDSGNENDVHAVPVYIDPNAVVDENTTVKNAEIVATVLAMSPEMVSIHPRPVVPGAI